MIAASIPTRYESEIFDRLFAAAAPDYSGTHCVVSFAGRIDARRLEQAVRLMLRAEPILACRWTARWSRPSWRRDGSIDVSDVARVHEGSSTASALERFIAEPPALPLRIALLRGATDVLCLKLDHRAGGGTATVDCAYLLADLYRKLGEDSSYTPRSNTDRRRGMCQLRARFTALETLRIGWRSASLIRHLRRTTGAWSFPGELREVPHFADTLEVDPRTITRETSSRDLSAWDSMGTINVPFWLNTEFGAALDPTDTRKVQSVPGILDLLAAAGKLS